MEDYKILEIISNSLKTSDKYITIRDSAGNIIYPRDIEGITDIEQLSKNKFNGTELYDLNSGNHYVKKASIYYIDGEPYVFELIENNNRYKKMEEKSKYDSTTKLLNKSSILKEVDNALLNGRKNLTSLAIAVCDIDNFKKINDTYSHLAGDYILEQVANIFKAYENENCQIGRFGGDEFILFFKNTLSDEIYYIIEKIKHKIENINIEFNQQQITNITMSFGIYAIDNYEDFHFTTLKQIIEKRKDIFYYADEALYKSKKEGKNRITLVNKEDLKKSNKKI